ncbi:hypothetical protein PQX77_018404 [Marasmius sp. AFHP31]|nr:hypothetical protein PQX77_018404 [Marasmius sp. AFHP31]
MSTTVSRTNTTKTTSSNARGTTSAPLAVENAKTTTAGARGTPPSSLATTTGNWRARPSNSPAISANDNLPSTVPDGTMPNKSTSAPSSSQSDVSKKSKNSKSSSRTARNRSSSFSTPASHRSLFGDNGDATAESLTEELNNVAIRRGKKSFPALRAANGDTPSPTPIPTDSEPEFYPADDEENPVLRLPRVASTNSRQSTQSQSQLRDYHTELRRRYVLQTMKDEDVEQWGISYIDDQGIIIDEENNTVSHPIRSDIVQPIRPVEWAEVKKLRTMHPQPFSHDDPIPSRRPPPPPAPLRFSVPDRHERASGSGGNGFPNRNNNNNRDNDNVNNRDLPPHMSGDPNGPGGPPSDGGGGPPSDPDEPQSSSDGSGDISEPENIPRAEVVNMQRYTSVEPTLSDRKKWTYDPTPQSEDEMLKAAFKPIEDLIIATLFGNPIRGNVGVQKTLLQSLPKPSNYSGNDDLTVFFDWVRELVRWLSTADLCGKDVRWSQSRNSYVRTSVDIQRTSATVAFLRGEARDFYSDVVEPIPDSVDPSDPLQGRWTFLQLIAALYRRFIHDASMHKVVDRYEAVRYTRSRGVEGLFNNLKKYAKALPTPPDAYNFRKRIMILLPSSFTTTMTQLLKVTAERSTLQEIMETAISLEQGEKAVEYYQEARRKLDRNRRRRSRSRSRRRSQSRDRSNRRSQSPQGYQKRDGSPKRLQKVNGHRYSVKPHSEKPKDDRPESLPVRDRYKNSSSSNKYEKKDYKSFLRPNPGDSRKTGSLQNKDSNSNRLFHMKDEEGNERVFQDVTSAHQAELDDDPDDEKVWARHEHESSDDSRSNRSHSPGPYGGSQYTSDDADERAGFMHDDYPYDGDAEKEDYSIMEPPEHLAAAWDSESDDDDAYQSCESAPPGNETERTHLQLDFNEYFRSIKAEDDGGHVATVGPTRVRSSNVLNRPKRSSAEKRCLAAWIEFDGVKAFTLFDSGSTADAVSPDFARTCKLKIYRLENPVTFQLGTKGSRSRITYGCTAKYSIATPGETIGGKEYFDIANIDRYDAVVGTVFMRRHGILLDFKNDEIRTEKSVVPTLSEGEESAELARRAAKRVQNENIHLHNGEEIEVRPRPKGHGNVLSDNAHLNLSSPALRVKSTKQKDGSMKSNRKEQPER